MNITREWFLKCLDRQKEILLEIEEKYKGKDWRTLDDTDPYFKDLWREYIEITRDINDYLSHK
jgi:hypothetical protein